MSGKCNRVFGDISIPFENFLQLTRDFMFVDIVIGIRFVVIGFIIFKCNSFPTLHAIHGDKNEQLIKQVKGT